MYRVFVQFLDTPQAFEIAQVLKLKKIPFKATLYDYRNWEAFVQQHPNYRADIMPESEIYCDTFYQTLQGISTYVLQTVDQVQATRIIGQIKLCQLNDQTRSKKQVILLNNAIGGDRSLICKKFATLLAREVVTGSIVNFGCIYDSELPFNNCYQAYINYIQANRTIPALPDEKEVDAGRINFTSSIKVAITVYRIFRGQLKGASYDLLDIQLSYSDFNAVVAQMFLPDDQRTEPPEVLAEADSSGKQPKRAPSGGKKDPKQQQDELQQRAVAQYIESKKIEYTLVQLTYELLLQKDCIYLPLIKGFLDQTSQNRIKPQQNEFSIRQFRSFLNYQQSDDQTINQIQDILQKEQLVDLINVFEVTRDVIGLFGLINMQRIGISLAGSNTVNQLDEKLKLLQDSGFDMFTYRHALEWLFQFGDAPRQAEFWKGYVGEEHCEKMAIMARLLHSKGFTENKLDPSAAVGEYVQHILGRMCEDFVDKAAKAPGKPTGGRQPAEEPTSETQPENSYVTALRLLMLAYTRQLDPRRHTAVCGFEDTAGTEVLRLCQDTTLEEALEELTEPRYLQYSDPKKVVNQVAKGQLSWQVMARELGVQPQQVVSLEQAAGPLRPRLRMCQVVNPIVHELVENGANSRLRQRRDVYDVYTVAAHWVERRFGRSAVHVAGEFAELNFGRACGLPDCTVFDASATTMLAGQRRALLCCTRLAHGLAVRQEPRATGQKQPASLPPEPELPASPPLVQQRYFLGQLKQRLGLTSDEAAARALFFDGAGPVPALPFPDAFAATYGASGFAAWVQRRCGIALAVPPSESLAAAAVPAAARAPGRAPSAPAAHVTYSVLFALQHKYTDIMTQIRDEQRAQERTRRQRAEEEARAYLDDAGPDGGGAAPAESKAGPVAQNEETRAPKDEPKAQKGTKKGEPVIEEEAPTFGAEDAEIVVDERFRRELLEHHEYCEAIGLGDALARALSNLMLAAQAGLVENQLEFLGEQFLEAAQRAQEATREPLDAPCGEGEQPGNGE